MKRALITGIGGQDGSYMAEVLLEQGYQVHGLYRHASYDNLVRVAHLRNRIHLHGGDVTDLGSVSRILAASQPDEIYHLADQDNVGWSYACPDLTTNVTARAVAGLLELIWQRSRIHPKIFLPVSATIFGSAPPPQDESTPLDPQSPYACAKAYALHLARAYRRRGLPVYTAILYNHDSPRRSPRYLLQQLCRQAWEVGRGQSEQIIVGDRGLRVDVGFARDYMLAAWEMMNLAQPDDYVIGTGVAPTIEEMVSCALDWTSLHPLPSNPVSENKNLLGLDGPRELIANPTKARNAFGFAPKTDWQELIQMIMEGLK